jgi:transcriptional regulator with XRE-family HTH domain
MTPVQFKDARKALGLTQKECAKTLGLKTSRAIRQYEAGRTLSNEFANQIGERMDKFLAFDERKTKQRKTAKFVSGGQMWRIV